MPHFLRHRLADFLVDRGIPLGAWITPILIGGGMFLLTDEPTKYLSANFFGTEAGWRNFGWFVLAIGVVVYIPTAVASGWRSKRITALEAEVSALNTSLASREREMEQWAHNLRDLVHGVLYTLAVELGFGQGEKHLDRITIYAHEEGPDGKGYFVPFGRLSFNTVFQKRGREFYPDDQGVIASAWIHEEQYVPDLPDYRKNPDAYVARCEAMRLPKEAVEAIRMKSRFLYGRRIKDETGMRGIAVVILESKTPNRYTKEHLREFFGRHERTLSQLVERIKPILPSAARGAGY